MESDSVSMEPNTFASVLMTSGRTNQSDKWLFGMTGNVSAPDGCILVLFSQLEDLIAANNPDGVISLETRRVVHQAKNLTMLCLFLFGTPTNVINMVVFYKQGLRDRVMLCLFFLAFTDAFVLTAAIVFQGEEIYKQFESKEEIGRHFAFILNHNIFVLYGSYYASPILSAIIAVERCVCVFNPMKFRSLIRTRTMALIIFTVYVVVFSLSFMPFTRFRIECLYDPFLRMSVRVTVKSKLGRENEDVVNFMEGVVIGVFLVGGTAVVVAITTILTTMKLRQVRKWRSETSSSFSSGEVGLTKMLIGSSIVFVICVSPFALFNGVRLFFPEVDYGKPEHNLYVCFAWIGETFHLVKPCASFIVYYTIGSRYRDVFWATFGLRKKRNTNAVKVVH